MSIVKVELPPPQAVRVHSVAERSFILNNKIFRSDKHHGAKLVMIEPGYTTAPRTEGEWLAKVGLRILARQINAKKGENDERTRHVVYGGSLFQSEAR
jgi:hypothetical protein